MGENTRKPEGYGVVKISEDVVGVIAGIAASELEGIRGLSATTTGGITQVVTGKRNLAKGVKVTVGDNDAIIDLVFGVEYGRRIPEIVSSVQEKVKETVETITGLKVSGVNVFVNDVYQKEPVKKEEKPVKKDKKDK
ncbi:MAG: Asp23/Gls24 family envelope stress response protein [Clostridium sp.]|nr:Asp23/Gls24 family envelope stress response protein [Clostridium sp.]